LQLELFPYFGLEDCFIKADELFQAYFDCRSNKRRTANAMAFEVDYESKLIQLLNDINTGNYYPGKSIAFIVNNPVKREIFAADFRDRVVHHLIINKLNPLLEKDFINDSYACRIGKGMHYGIKRVDTFIRRCSQNYKEDCYILKLDIQAFFMNINRKLLFDKLHNYILDKYHYPDQKIVLDLCRKIIFYSPIDNCIIKGVKSDWNGLPKSKSLFNTPKDCGLPIGNLTSQVFANFYLNSFDHFIKHNLKTRHYGRYVDDFVIVHKDKEYLKSIIPKIKSFLADKLFLTLHPHKIYLQHYSKGVKYLGAVIMPNRIYITNRTKGNFYNSIIRHNQVAENHKPDRAELQQIQCSINSYLGIMVHYKSYNIRKYYLIKYLNSFLKKRYTTTVKYSKVLIK
jgi:RNA-directed DNA polymerase